MSWYQSTGAIIKLMQELRDDLLAYGVIDVYSGAHGTDPDSAMSGTQLVRCTVSSGAFTPGTTTNGLTLYVDHVNQNLEIPSGVTWSGTGLDTGVAQSAVIRANGAETGDTDFATAPGALTAALAGSGAGNVEDGDHYYKVTYVTLEGETEAGTASAVLTVADKSTNGQVSLTAIPTSSDSRVTARKVYRTKAGASTYYLLTTISDNSTTTYTDNTADASLGAEAPYINTTMAVRFCGNVGTSSNADFKVSTTQVTLGATFTIDSVNLSFPSYYAG